MRDEDSLDLQRAAKKQRLHAYANRLCQMNFAQTVYIHRKGIK